MHRNFGWKAYVRILQALGQSNDKIREDNNLHISHWERNMFLRFRLLVGIATLALSQLNGFAQLAEFS